MSTEHSGFYNNSGPYTIQEIADLIGAKVIGDATRKISAIRALKDAGPNDITFLENSKYMSAFQETKAGACIVVAGHESSNKAGSVLLQVDQAYFAYAKLLELFYHPKKETKPGIAASAVIAKSARIGKNCQIGANVVIEDEVEIGDDAVIGAGSHIDYGVRIGNRARIDANVSISHALIGDDVVILPGASIGQDGFGFATYRGRHKKVLHIGRVLIGNDVEIGANSCIDRGSMQDTIIEDGCRLDNLVQLGHNVHIKRGSVIVAQVGIAGSTRVGQYCVFGGQVGVAGHIEIADQTSVAAQSGVAKSIKEPGSAYGGTPAVPIREWHKQSIVMKNLVRKK